ncbi:MAG: hypothetical protein CM15mP16_06090 [Candidatus Pelagibacterales bacterium]|nr:MAG: hypothetical protein CM15mP16_06090 [Pelagibacterales bacterium]
MTLKYIQIFLHILILSWLSPGKIRQTILGVQRKCFFKNNDLEKKIKKVIHNKGVNVIKI